MPLLPWHERGLGLIVPIATAVKVVDRARRFDVENGGRFDAKTRGAIVLWSVERGPDGERSLPVASIVLKWLRPTPAHVTVDKVAWDPERSDEFEALRALRLLLPEEIIR